MQLVAPDILAEASGLSAVLCGLALVTGFFLWLYGWRWHRFWIVLLTTVLAGVQGVYRAPDYHSQPLLCGVLLAVASGVLALSLIRLVAYVAGGVATCLLLSALGPSWGDPLIGFLVGGLAGLTLFRIWIMALTSLGGSLLMAYAVLCLLDRWARLPAATWSERHRLLLNWACAGLTLAGVVGQVYLERRRERKQQEAEAARKEEEKKRAAPPPPPPPPPPAPPARPWWWNWAEKLYRKAG